MLACFFLFWYDSILLFTLHERKIKQLSLISSYEQFDKNLNGDGKKLIYFGKDQTVHEVARYIVTWKMTSTYLVRMFTTSTTQIIRMNY